MANPSRAEEGTAKPRARLRAKSQDTRNNIISVAIGLFRTKGYTRTSMSEIARQAGVDPSSFYYYFASKEALIENILNPNEFFPTVEQLERACSNRAAQLYALIAFDVVHKCELPFDFWELEAIANENPKGFEAFFERYRKLYRTSLSIIERGVEEGAFVPCAADERTVTILSTNEGLQHHFHAKHREELILEASGYSVRDYTPEDIARMTGRSVLPSLMKNPSEIEAAVEEGRRLYYLMRNKAEK